MRSIARMAALHSALWGYDRPYRMAWYVWPAALAVLIAGWICSDKPAGVASSAAASAKVATLPVTNSIQEQLTKCFSIREPGQAYLCTSVINTGQVRGQQLAQAHLQLGFVQREKDPDRALTEYDAALKVRPYFSDALAGRAWIRMNRGQYEYALPDLNKAIESSPPSTPAAIVRYYRGYAHLKLKNYPQALIDLNEAIRLQPDNADVYFARGETQQALENYDAALRDFDEFAKRAPRDARGQAFRGSVLDAMGRSTEALAAFENAVRLEPGNAYAVSERDRLREQQNEDEKSKPK
jgi:Flp pilus assembly protein TadD